MANKNKGKVIPMLSPENYIRTKARSLPIYECIINADWQDSNSALITVARKHTTGNITTCFYYVDLMCLGVKDTMYFFNMSALDYESSKIEMYEDFGREKIDYTLAHNIIYAGVEFADEYGFKPHKDFVSITRFMLEEDSDDIELIDIECGENGKPLYVRGPYDDDHKANQIINQLEKTAGHGNYSYISEEDDFPDDDFDDDEDDEAYQEELEKSIDVFAKLSGRFEKLKSKDLKSLIEATEVIFQELIDRKLFDKYADEFEELHNIEIITVTLPDEIIGSDLDAIVDPEQLKEMFAQILALLDEFKIKKAAKIWERYKQIAGELASVYYLELRILQAQESKKYMEKLEQYIEKFPNHVLIKFLYLTEKFSSMKYNEKVDWQRYGFRHFFGKRRAVHQIEMMYFLIFNFLVITAQNDASRLDAFHQIVDELEIQPEQKQIIMGSIALRKIVAVTKYLEENNKIN